MDQTQSQAVAEIRGEEILTRVLERVSHALTEADLKLIASLDAQDDEQGSLVDNFLRAKVPNFGEIMQEEMEAYKALQKS